MPLKSRRKFPPGHWQFYQPQTNWSAPMGLDFDGVVRAIAQHRAANPRFNLSTDPVVIADELDAYTCQRINFDPNYCTGGPAGKAGAQVPSRRRLSERVRGAVAAGADYARKTVAGIQLYLDWFGSGAPVPAVEAERRAGICVQCPKLVAGNIAQRFNAAAAQEIMTVFGMLNDLDLHTSLDDRLGVCDPCDCPMRAKVWTPLPLIEKHLLPQARAGLWEKCWITEKSEPQNIP